MFLDDFWHTVFETAADFNCIVIETLVTNWRNFFATFVEMDSSFIQVGIKEFYPPINEDILKNTIQLSKLYTTIDYKSLRLIMHCRKSLRFFGNKGRRKKSEESCLDVTMCSFDGAEICELAGLYIQPNLENILSKTNFGLYRNDGLILLRNLNGQHMDKKRKAIIRIFQDIGFSIDIQTRDKEVDLFDVTLNLQNSTYPYKKASDNLLYIDSSSNHPP